MGTSFIPLCAIIVVLIIAFLFASLPQINRVNSTLEKYPVNEESSDGKYPVNENSTLEKYPVKRNVNKPVGRTAQRIIDMVISNPMITREKMANELGISLDGVKKQIKNLRDRGILIHEGSDKAGYWRIIVKP